MNAPEPGSPLVLEVGLALLILIVFVVGLFMRGPDKRRVGVLTAIGLVVLFGLSWRTEAGAELFRVVDAAGLEPALVGDVAERAQLLEPCRGEWREDERAQMSLL